MFFFYLIEKFAERNIKDDPLVNLVRRNYEVIPKVLDSLGKVKNPYVIYYLF
jgi:citrate synthase